MKLSQKFTAALVVVMTLTLTVRGFIDGQRATEEYEAAAYKEQRRLANVLKLAVTNIWQTDGWQNALGFLESVERQGDVRIRWVWLEPTEHPEYDPIVSAETIRERLKVDGAITFDRTLHPGQVVTYQPVRLDKLPLGAIEIARSTDEVEAIAASEFRRQALISVIVLLVYAFVASILGRKIIGEPIEGLIAQAKRVGRGNFEVSSAPKQNDEVGLLGREMNRMAERLEEARTKAGEERAARLEIQDQLTHANRLASVGQMTAALIHDLGTPLNIISGRATMIAENDIEPDQVPDNARRISDQAMRIAEMIQNLLTFARRGELARQTVVLTDAVNEVVALVAPLTSKARVTVEVDERQRFLKVDVNQTQIRQVLMNLVMNGVQAMPEGGAIRIAVEEDLATSEVVVQISDQGAGISPEARQKIFEPFFTTKGEREGTGLGLSVCSSIIEQHGGSIAVTETSSEGTTFCIRLPRAGTAS